jgi:hypothetical protein
MRIRVLCLIGMALMAGCSDNIFAPRAVPGQLNLFNTSRDTVIAKVTTVTGIKEVQIGPSDAGSTLAIPLGNERSAEVFVAFYNVRTRELTDPESRRIRPDDPVTCTYKTSGTTPNVRYWTSCR